MKYEWRYVPNIKSKDYEHFPPVMSENDKIFDVSNKLAEHEEYALTFEYEDIRYFLLKNKQDREDFINFIISLPTSVDEKNLLISKIIVYEEEMGDW